MYCFSTMPSLFWRSRFILDVWTSLSPSVLLTTYILRKHPHGTFIVMQMIYEQFTYCQLLKTSFNSLKSNQPERSIRRGRKVAWRRCRTPSSSTGVRRGVGKARQVGIQRPMRCLTSGGFMCDIMFKHTHKKRRECALLVVVYALSFMHWRCLCMIYCFWYSF